MAGSYNHAVDRETGLLKSNEDLPHSLENGGDVFETVEEMYGMIWYLATQLAGYTDDTEEKAKRVRKWVDEARKNYPEGLSISKQIHLLHPKPQEN